MHVVVSGGGGGDCCCDVPWGAGGGEVIGVAAALLVCDDCCGGCAHPRWKYVSASEAMAILGTCTAAAVVWPREGAALLLRWWGWLGNGGHDGREEIAGTAVTGAVPRLLRGACRQSARDGGGGGGGYSERGGFRGVWMRCGKRLKGWLGLGQRSAGGGIVWGDVSAFVFSSPVPS